MHPYLKIKKQKININELPFFLDSIYLNIRFSTEKISYFAIFEFHKFLIGLDWVISND